MSILAQHGHGKSAMIQRGLAGGAIDGVIMSPRNEPREKLASFLTSTRVGHPSAQLLADPQFYVGTVPQAYDMRLGDYRHYVPGLTLSSFRTPEIRQYVTDTLTWQYGLDVSAIISPTVPVDDLQGPWAQVASKLAQETVAQYSDDRPLLISLVIGESALRQSGLVDAWLDDLAELDVAGFYVIVRRDSQDYRRHFEATALASLLRMSYSLGELLGYKVVVGYVDMATLLLHAAGSQATGAGWYSNLRQFHMARFEKSRGGPPRQRYSSLPLLNSIFVTELGGIHRGPGVANVTSGTPFDARFNGNTDPTQVHWPLSEAAVHHWHVLDEITKIPIGANISDRLDAAQVAVRQAAALYRQMAPFASFTSITGASHLTSWSDGLIQFQTQAGV